MHVPNLMLPIPSGAIVLRDDRKKTTWQVEIPAFLLGRLPVTQELYAAVTGSSPSALKGPRHPVESVSWEEAVAFCEALSRLESLPAAQAYRLPTEAEWQYACQAGTPGPRYAALEEIAWFRDNSGGAPHPVGEKAPNAWGLHDMLGNVWEWCSDLYDPVVYGTYRVFRGGGWSDTERGCLATNRRRGHPTFRIDDLGFRIARSSV